MAGRFGVSTGELGWARLPRKQIRGRSGDDGVEAVAGGSQPGQELIDAISFTSQTVQECGGGLSVDDTGREFSDDLAGQARGVKLLDQSDPLNSVVIVVALSPCAALRHKQALLLVIAQRPGGHARSTCEFTDTHAELLLSGSLRLAFHVDVKF
ncbi:hypothetical protein AWC31_31305 [Mycolicibacterium wolinskyi]|uniref:Uncharacterized protein n=1 Tax=Mycolicibacterium wolinskyi TaxID=59750 RepID=A0A1X2F220_9MYCO|nr:hypothetical protein AWC31_31305 [Mycolicibacterium wolinskyi]